MYNNMQISIKIKILTLFIVQMSLAGHAQVPDTVTTVSSVGHPRNKVANDYLQVARAHVANGDGKEAVALLNKAVALQHDVSDG